MAGLVFISHSSRDIEIARGVCEAIEQRGVACWISGRDVGVGEHYGDAIVEAIERARAMVLVFSRNANHSEEIKKELALASKLGVAVFPVRIEEIEPTGAFRYELMTRQWIDLFADRDEAVKKLTEKIVALPAKAGREGEGSSAPEPAPAASPPLPPPARRPRRLGALVGAAAVIVLLAVGAVLWAHSGTGGDPAHGQALASQGGTTPAAPAPALPVVAPAAQPAPKPFEAVATPASAPVASVAAAPSAAAPAPAAALAAPKPTEVASAPVSPSAASAVPTPSAAPPAPAAEPALKAAEVAAAPVSASPATAAALEAPRAKPGVASVAATEAASSPSAPSPPQPPPNEPASPRGQTDAAPSAVQPEKPAPRPISIASLASGAAGVGDAAATPATLIAPPAPIAPELATEPPHVAEADSAAKPIVRALLAAPAPSDAPAAAPARLAGPAPAVEPSPAPASAAPPAPTKPVVVASLATTAQPDKRPPADGPVKTFKDCAECPEMVVAPAGSALVGSPPQETARKPDEAAPSEAVIPAPFAIGRYDVTFDEWEACVAAGGCNNWLPGDFGWGRGRQPVIFVSWSDAHAYVAWLSAKTGKPYRLLSETEWEYAARGCTTTACPNKPFWFGSIKPEIANYDSRYAYEGSPKGLSRRRAVATDEGPPNPFGLFNMLGNVRQWVEDCWSADPGPAPAGGAPRLGGDCSERVTRGGSYDDKPQELRAAARSWQTAETRSQKIGFRVARALDP